MELISGHGMLKYVEPLFKFKLNKSTRCMELSYAILKSCGRLLNIPGNRVEMQNVFTAIEQRMEEVSPDLGAMLQELVDLRERNWVDIPDDVDTKDE
ncbi:hypothetical protein BDZ89DRAFT_1148660 [Hymenopellis radicata]|nr:hypothetical protein BDZ89DRAFT_1148660 [Hymenopellis radicata]